MKIKKISMILLVIIMGFLFMLQQLMLYIQNERLSEIIESDCDTDPLFIEENWVPTLPRLDRKNVNLNINKSCAPYPEAFEVELNNKYWQTFKASNRTFQLFGAYLDNRTFNQTDDGPSIRILGMICGRAPTMKIFCQVWFDKFKQPVIVEVFSYRLIWRKEWKYWKKIYRAYLMSCLLPAEYWNEVPVSVSIVEKPCHAAKNNLKVIYDRPTIKKDFAVCVKGLDIPIRDISVKLVEWIELIRLLGADKIFFYELNVHPHISKILTYYQQEGYVHVTPFTLPGRQPNIPNLQHLFLQKYKNKKEQIELISYNDCFYKHMYQYKYIVLLDVDEIIMPMIAYNWAELFDNIAALETQDEIEYTSYSVKNFYFFHFLRNFNLSAFSSERELSELKNIPKYMYMLRHVFRATYINGFERSFHNTKNVVTLHSTYPLSCVGGLCKNYEISIYEAQKHHYCHKSYFRKNSTVFHELLLDTNIWRYKNQLINKVSKVLRTQNFFE